MKPRTAPTREWRSGEGIEPLGSCLPGTFKQDARFAFQTNAPIRIAAGQKAGVPDDAH